MSTIANLKLGISVATGGLQSGATRANKSLGSMDDAAKQMQSTIRKLQAQFNSGKILGYTLESETQKAKQRFREVREAAKQMERGTVVSFGSIGGAAKNLAIAGLAANTLRQAIHGISSVLSTPLMLAGNVEKAGISFKVLLGSAGEASKMLKSLQTFAATTPYEMPEITSSATALLAMGFAADKIIPTMTTLGNTASALNIPFNELAELYGKARNEGTILKEQLNMLTGRGIPILDTLMDQLNMSSDELKKFVSDGKLQFDDLEIAMSTLGNTKFKGMMEEQSRSFLGVLSTMKDNVSLVLTDIGDEFIKGFDMKSAMQGVIAFSSTFKENYMPSIRDVISGFASMKSIAMEYVNTIRTNYMPTLSWIIQSSGQLIDLVIHYRTVLLAATSVIAGVAAAMMVVVTVQKAIAVQQALVLALGGPAGWSVLAAGAAIGLGAMTAVSIGMDSLAEDAQRATAATDVTAESLDGVGTSSNRAADGIANMTSAMQEQIKLAKDQAAETQRLKDNATLAGKSIISPMTAASLWGAKLGLSWMTAKTAADDTSKSVTKIASESKDGAAGAGAISTSLDASAKAAKEAAKAMTVWRDEVEKPLKIEAAKVMDELNPIQALKKKFADIAKAGLSEKERTILIYSEIDKSSGVFTDVKKLRQDIDILGNHTTETEQKLNEMLNNGAPTGAVNVLRTLYAEREKLKEQDKARDNAKSIYESVQTPLQTYITKLNELKRLRSEIDSTTGKPFISAETFKTAALDALPDKVKAIIERTKSPMQKFREGLNELTKFKLDGLINPEQFAKAAKELQADIFKKPEFQLVANAEAGSREANSAIAKFRSGNRSNDPTEKLHKTARQQLAEQQKANRLLASRENNNFTVVTIGS